MKKSYLVMAVLLACLSYAAVFAGAEDDIQSHKNCKICGMDRKAFDYSRVLIEYSDGTTVGTCSMRCAALDMALNIGKVPKSVMVADFHTHQLIDAEKAFWVLGGKKEGTMSSRGKWAFATKKGASVFISRNGGRHATYQKVLKASFGDLYKDLTTFWAGMKRHQEETE